MDFNKLRLTLTDWLINQLMTWTDTLTISHEEKVYQAQLKEICQLNGKKWLAGMKKSRLLYSLI